MPEFTFLSLFSGIGGLDLGLERAGMRCIGQVEIDPFCRRVLAKHWPDVPRWEDVRTFNRSCLNGVPDLIAGGFPCQDISKAGRRAGLDGEKSGLWYEFSRILRDLRPRYALVENVPAILSPVPGNTQAPISGVLRELAEYGFDAEWAVLPACAFGAPQLRERLFIVAYPMREGLEGEGLQKVFTANPPLGEARRLGLSESDTLRSRNDVPDFMDRIRALGNAVVPQVAEWIGRRILAAEGVNQPTTERS